MPSKQKEKKRKRKKKRKRVAKKEMLKAKKVVRKKRQKLFQQVLNTTLFQLAIFNILRIPSTLCMVRI